jgi:hypothetical protein
MHPSQRTIRDLVDGHLDRACATEILAHLAECEFCREYLDNYKLYIESVNQSKIIELPAGVKNFADELYGKAILGKIIPLTHFGADTISVLYNAADGSAPLPDIINLATYYSENPELVMRVMRDRKKDIDYIQLIGAEPNLTSNILVQLPDENKEFLTDGLGQAILKDISSDKISNLKWQIKMPDASFSLYPLKYDPDKVEYEKEITLETDRHDKIKVTFAGKTEGKQINIRIVELDGKSDFGRVRISVSQNDKTDLHSIAANEILSFNLVKPDSEIKIRLFQ